METKLAWWSCKNDLFSKMNMQFGVENGVLKGGDWLFTVS